MHIVRRVAAVLVVAVVLSGRASADSWQERLAANVAKTEGEVAKLDGKAASKGSLAKRLADLDMRIGALEEQRGRRRKSERVAESGTPEEQISNWTQVCVSLSSRLASLVAEPPKPAPSGAPDDAREKRLETELAAWEASVGKKDGRVASKGGFAERLESLDARISDLEASAGRTAGSEKVLKTGERSLLLDHWTAVLARLSARFLLSEQQAPVALEAGGPRPDPATLVGSGTGFFITADGILATCAHVVDGGVRYRVVAESGDYEAMVVAKDEARDLAILRVRGTFHPLPIAPSESARLGASVGTVGYPNPELQGTSPKATRGEISSLAGLQDDPSFFQVSLPVQPGNSGGALFDARGNVVGVIAGTLNPDAARETSGVLAQNVNYAVKSTNLLNLVASVPGLASRLPAPSHEERKFEDAVGLAQQATAMVMVYDPSARSRGAGLPRSRHEIDPKTLTFEKGWPRQIEWPSSCDDWGRGYVVSYPTGEWHAFTRPYPGGPEGSRSIHYRRFRQTGQEIVWHLEVTAAGIKAGARRVHFRAVVSCEHGAREVEDDWVSPKPDGFYSGASERWVIGRQNVAGPVVWWPEDTQPTTSDVPARYAFHVDHLVCNKGETVLFGDAPAAVALRCLRGPPQTIECLGTQAYVALASGNMTRFATLVDWASVGAARKTELLDQWKAQWASNRTLGQAIADCVATGGPSIDAPRIQLANCTITAVQKPGGRWYVTSVGPR